MRKYLLLAALITVLLKAIGQQTPVVIDTIRPPSPVLLDGTPVKLGLLIGDNQTYLGEKQTDIVISKPTVKSQKKAPDGTLTIEAYINNDWINVIARGITLDNSRHFQVERHESWDRAQLEAVRKGNPSKYPPLPSAFHFSKYNPTFVDAPGLNENKKDGRSYLFVVKDLRNGAIASSLALHFVDPTPVPEFLSLDPSLIGYYEQQPGTWLGISEEVRAAMRQKVDRVNKVNSPANSNTGLPAQLVLPPRYNDLLFRFRQLKDGAVHHLQYRFSSDSNWRTTPKNERPFIILHDLPAGRYQLQVRYPNQADAVFTYNFEVSSPWTQTAAFRLLAISGTLLLLTGGGFYGYHRVQRRRLQAENARRRQLQAQVSALRAQLNPHFIFNALGSIQGLVNKNDPDGANLYISKFGSLLRDILEKNDRMQQPLSQEIRQVETYLQLEQLRFHFRYHIQVQPGINTTETDFPVMLLQPFVENAIRHGISGKNEAGCIALTFERKGSQLVVSIADNGRGFDPGQPASGYGIKLIEERIAVLNQLFPGQPISTSLRSFPQEGTTVQVQLSNWL